MAAGPGAMPGAGQLNRRITLQRVSTTRDALGGDVETWGDLASVWAMKEDLSALERLRAAQEGELLTTRFTIRWGLAWSDLGGRDRVVYEGLTYNIIGVREIGRRRGLEIAATVLAENPDRAHA